MEKALTSSRRSFVMGAGATALGVVLAGVTGCAPKTQTAATQTAATGITSVSDITWDEEYDVIVVGAGLAGMSAAVTVATEGEGATCLLLEKGQSELGNGNSPFSSGKCLYTDNLDNFTAYVKECRGNFDNTPDDVIESYAQGVIENLDWVLSLGANEAEMEIGVPGQVSESQAVCYPEYPELPHSAGLAEFHWLKGNESGIEHVQEFMYSVKQQHTDTITEKTNSPLIALVQDPETKAVLGAVYKSGSDTINAKANRGVIMACGGFENNKTMMQDYLSAPIAYPRAGQCNEGDGITICQKLGAALWHMNSVAGFWTNIRTLDDSQQGAYFGIAKDKGITVGVNGRRFYMDWDACVIGHVYEPQSDLSSNVGCRHGHMNFGGEWTHLPMPAKSWFVFDDAGFKAGAFNANGTDPQAGANGSDPVSDGFGYKADTLEELAEQMGVPTDQFVETVETWNSYCKNGKDLSFFRPEESLTPISTPPFYACNCVPEFVNTDGGPQRGANGEILDLEGNPIPNLYSAGEFGSVWCNMYQGAGNLGECLAFGRISARSALANA